MSNWGDFVFNEPYNGDEIKMIGSVTLPLNYVEFMRKHNGGEGDIGNTWFRLYTIEELQEINDDYEVWKYLPGHIIIGGSDGELYGIDTDGNYFNVPEIIEVEYLTLLGNDIDNLPDAINKLWE